MKNIDKLLNDFISDFKELYAERLTSIVIYGSCAKESCDDKESEVNAIVVINNLSASDLKSANKIIKKWVKENNLPPIFMDKEEWFDSTDVYPIEYSDIKERYKIIYGEDIVAPLNLSNQNLRLMCEHEIKNILIKLRQYYLLNSSDLKSVESLIINATKSIIAVARGILKLSNNQVPHKPEDIVNLLSQSIDINKDTFLKVLESRHNKTIIKKDEYENIVQTLIDSTNSILKVVDKL